jgi:iron(III) transport system substrate-binding protein
MLKRKSILLFLTIGYLMVAFIVIGVSCKGNAADGELNLYISGPQKMVKALEKGFEEIHGNVLNVYHTGCGPLRQKVWTEMMAGSIQADIIWGAEPIMYQALKEKGVLMQYKSPQIENIKEEYIYGDGYYTAVNARYGIIVYNKKNVEENDVPDAWSGLMNNKWQDRLVMADASQSAMALAITAGLYQIRGDNWDLHQALAANNVMLTKQNIKAVSTVENGEADVGIAPHDGVLRLIKKAKKNGVKSSLKIAWPREGAISIQRPIAIIKKERSSANERLAKAFINYALSKKAQNISSKFGFITVRRDLKLPAGVPENVESVILDWEYASSHEGELRAGFKEVIFAE